MVRTLAKQAYNMGHGIYGILLLIEQSMVMVYAMPIRNTHSARMLNIALTAKKGSATKDALFERNGSQLQMNKCIFVTYLSNLVALKRNDIWHLRWTK